MVAHEVREENRGRAAQVRPKRRRTRRRNATRTWFRAVQRSLWEDDEQAGPHPTRRTIAREHLAPLALYALITVVTTYPLVLHFTTRIISFEEDALMNLWGYWWAGEALTSLRNPYWTPLLYAPEGVPLYLHTLNLINGLLSLPFQWLFGTTVAYNMVVCLSFVLAAYFAYLLVAEVSGSRPAGFVGEIVYAFSSYQFTHLLGHTNLIASEWLPAYALCLLRAIESRGRRRTRYALLAIGALTLLMLTDWQYVVFAVALTGIVAPWYAVARRSPAPLVAAAAIGLGWAIIALPLVIPTLRETALVETPDPGAARVYSADILSFVIPGTRSVWFGAWAIGAKRYFSAPPVEGDVFLGWLPLALAILALLLRPRRATLWWLVALLFGLFALGPFFQYAGNWRHDGPNPTIDLPYGLVQTLPGFNYLRTPIRLTLMVTLACAVLAGIAVAAGMQRWPALARARIRPLWLGGLSALLLAEHLALPFPLVATTVPAFYRDLANSPEQGTILEWPLSFHRSESNLYETVHRHPIMGGYIARRVAYPVRALPPFRDLPPPDADIIAQEFDPNLGQQVLAWAGVRWIVIYREELPLIAEGLPQFLERYTDGPPLYEDATMIVYRPKAVAGSASYLQPGNGFYDLEQLGDRGGNLRWFATASALAAWHFGPQPGRYALRFDAISFNNPRRLEVLLDGQSLGQWRVDATQHFDIPLTLTAGHHTIELRALDPPISPASVGLNRADTRPLAFGIANVRLAR